MTEIQRQKELQRIDQAIEEYSTAIARLLQACGSNRNFGEDQMREFQRLFRSRRRLIIRLERLQRAQIACAPLTNSVCREAAN
uniref:Uncharacterized protein n=1 Tax=Paracidobacterium acidisoli TaxID=2303751 RepID=A0A372IN18_9BACT